MLGCSIVGPPQQVHGRVGLLTTYWVEFDTPQYDVGRDGPSWTSQILEEYLASTDE